MSATTDEGATNPAVAEPAPPGQPIQASDELRPWGPWLECSDPSPGVAVGTVTGDVDSAGVGVLAPFLRRLVGDEEAAARAIVVDLSRVGFLALAAVEVLLQAAGQAAAAQREFLVVLGTQAVQRAFEVTGVEAAIRCYGNQTEALAAADAWARYQAAVHEGMSNDAHRSIE